MSSPLDGTPIILTHSKGVAHRGKHDNRCGEIQGRNTENTETPRKTRRLDTETKLVFSANTRALRHIIELRGAPGAEAEIRRFAVRLLRLMQTEAPNLFGDMEIIPLPDGSETVQAHYHKV